MTLKHEMDYETADRRRYRLKYEIEPHPDGGQGEAPSGASATLEEVYRVDEGGKMYGPIALNDYTIHGFTVAAVADLEVKAFENWLDEQDKRWMAF